MKKRGYHFCAMVKADLPYNDIQFYDGTFVTAKDPTDKNDFINLKNDIGKKMEPPHDGEGIILISLTKINP